MRILRHSGLYRECPIQISREWKRLSGLPRDASCWDPWKCTANPGRRLVMRHHSSPPCWHPTLPVAVLRVCRQVYEEGVSILYGENRFIVDCLPPDAVKRIRGLSLRSKSYLRYLHVFVGSSLAHDLFMQPRFADGDWDPFYGKALESNTGIMKANGYVFPWAIKQLKDLCESISSHVRPGQLDLEVSFSIDSTEGGLNILKCLQSLPQVSQLSFCTRIGGDEWVKYQGQEMLKANVQWQEILRKHARAMIKERPLALPFPFERLPREIQLQILRLVVVTDSAIPHLRVTGRCQAYINDRTPRTQSSGCCRTCRRYLSWDVCRCSLGAYFSSSCTCPILSDGIFLVSKQVRRDAIDTFFWSNEFLFEGSPALSNLRHLVREDSWIWRVKKICVDTYFLPPQDIKARFQDVLHLLYRFQERSKCEITFSFGGHSISDDNDKIMSRLREFYRLYKEAGLDPSQIWVPKKRERSPSIPVCNDKRGSYCRLSSVIKEGREKSPKPGVA